MKSFIFAWLIFIMVFLANGCAVKKSGLENPMTMGQNDGLSYERAIVVPEKSEITGVNWEYKWLAENYPEYKFKGQSLAFENDKPYDIIEIKTKKGRVIKIYFDISNYFGKF
ncbi:MAG: hypothetical protein N2445_03215 [Acidobacteria bacterium]|nr:hypothetical protein [Acidobacteriota bacterium]